VREDARGVHCEHPQYPGGGDAAIAEKIWRRARVIEAFARMFVAPQTLVLISRISDERVVAVSDSFEHVFGIAREVAVGRTTRELGLWHNERERQTLIDLLMHRGTAVREPVSARTRDGRYFDGLASFELLEHEGERYIFALLQDVREHADPLLAHRRELESFRSLFTDAEIGVYRRWPENHGFVDVNPALAVMLGYGSAAEFMAEVSKDPLDLHLDREHGRALLENLSTNGRISRERSALRRRDGTGVFVSENARAVLGAGGDVLFYEGTLIDISTMVSAQAALAQSESLYRSLIENCRDGVFLIQHGTMRFCNEALAQTLDFSASELIGSSYLERIAPEDLQAQSLRRQARESGSMAVQDYEVHLLRKDGTPRLFAVRAGAVIYEGEPASIGTMRDVTEASAQRDRLADAEERYRLALWGSGDDLFEWDLQAGELVPIGVDAQGQAMVRQPLPSVDQLTDFVHLEDFPALRDAILEHLAGRTDHFEATYRLRSRSGNWKWKLGRGMIVARDANGAALRLSGTQRDISSIKKVETALLELTSELDARVQARTLQLEDQQRVLETANAQLSLTIQALQQTQGELIEAEKMASLGRLVAGVAHEVNTPLGVGVTALSYLRDQIAPVRAALSASLPKSRVDELLQPIDSASAMAENNLFRAAGLISNFKQVAVDQSTSSIRRVRVRDYLERTLQSLMPAFRKTAHKVEIDCDAALEIVSRPDALHQITVNLLMNSLNHAFDDGRVGHIRMIIAADGNTLKMRYQDDGCGMQAEVARRVFEPFFTTKRNAGGTGLGMHIVYNLVTQALAGRIELDTAPGSGVRIDIGFPIRHPASDGSE